MFYELSCSPLLFVFPRSFSSTAMTWESVGFHKFSAFWDHSSWFDYPPISSGPTLVECICSSGYIDHYEPTDPSLGGPLFLAPSLCGAHLRAIHFPLIPYLASLPLLFSLGLMLHAQ